jgi:hypothetical protein
MGSQRSSSQVASRVSRLPSRFPVGTRYVIEGRAGQIHQHYLEFPDGRHIELPSDLSARKSPRSGRVARALRQKAAVRKF